MPLFRESVIYSNKQKGIIDMTTRSAQGMSDPSQMPDDLATKQELKRRLFRNWCLLKREQAWAEKLEKHITSCGYKLPKREATVKQRIQSFFSRRWLCIASVFVLTVTLVCLAIAFMPYQRNGEWFNQPRNPITVVFSG